MIKVFAVLGAVIAALLAMIGYKNNKIDNLEDENEGLEIKQDIIEQQNKKVREVVAGEKVRIKKRLLKKSKSRRDHFNNL